jgi:hypothetical protein
MRMETRLMQLNSQIEERKRNLKVIDECIEADPNPSRKLIEVREFLQSRINRLEAEVAQTD